jgi:hypothetical protein
LDSPPFQRSQVQAAQPRERNANTEYFADGTGPRVPPDLRAAYAFARGVVRNSPDALRGRPGHRLMWVHRSGYGGIPLLAHPDAFTIVGRHTQCGACLPADPFVALRHVLVRSIALPNGKVALRLQDLHTDAGFLLTDGSRQTSIFAEGPVAVGIGDYALIGLPSVTPDDALPNELPAPEIDTPKLVRDQIAAMEQAMNPGPYRMNARRPTNRCTRITLMPRLVMLGESIASPSLGRLATGTRWAVTLERKGRTASVTLTADELKGGVVIGRSEKCHSEELRRITDYNTSRVHLLVLREGEKVHAFDLASTQGVHLNGFAVRRADLHDEGTILLLGKGDAAVRLFWRRA